MYQAYHDSGISTGLSPTQDSDPRRGLLYRTCPDSGISELGSQTGQCSLHVPRGCCQADEVLQRQPQLQYVYGDQVQVHAHQEQKFDQQLHPVALQHELLRSSVPNAHGACRSDNLNLQNVVDYNLPLAHTTNLGLPSNSDRDASHFSLVRHSSPEAGASQSKLCVHANKNGHQPNGQLIYQASPTTESPESSFSHPLHCSLHQDPLSSPVNTEHHLPSSLMASSSTIDFHVHQLPDSDTDYIHTSERTAPLSSPLGKPLRQYYRDSGVLDTGQSHSTSVDRPDSQASHSSTTDSEDSGFRSSYCAAHHKSVLTKQGNPLLKPLRRTKKNRTSGKISKPSVFKTDNLRPNRAAARATSSPQNLQSKSKNSHTILNSANLDSEHNQRKSRIHQEISNISSSISKDTHMKPSSIAAQSADAYSFQDSSLAETFLQSSVCDKWPPQSSNDEGMTAKQSIDLNDISNHLSWTYLQNLSSSNRPNPEFSDGGMVLQACHQGIRSGQTLQVNEDQHVEMYGYSIV